MERKPGTYDAVLIGGGHNGLVCAFYLARAGLKVRVLERRGVVGGAAVTEEFHPGFRNSVASYTVSLLNPRVIADLNLAAHGLKVVFRPMSNFLPLENGDALRVGPDLFDTQAEVRRFSATDAARLPDYYAMLGRLADTLREFILVTPPDPNRGIGGVVETLKVAMRLKGLPLAAQRDLIELFGRSAGEMLDDWFETDALKTALRFVAQLDHRVMARAIALGVDSLSKRGFGAAARALVTFKELNLNAPTWPMSGSFQVVFCRNVAIYFDDPTQERLWRRFAPLTTKHGRLYVGHSERLDDPALATGKAIIQREGPATRAVDAHGKAPHLGVENLVVPPYRGLGVSQNLLGQLLSVHHARTSLLDLS